MVSIMNTRTCQACGKTFPEDRKHFGNFKNDRNGVITIGWRGKCKECGRGRARAYYRDNKEMSHARTALRRERLKDAGAECSDAEKAAIKHALGGCCRYCSTPFDGNEELDHLTPVARGGTNDIGNLTYACHACNRAKGSKSLTEYMVFRVERHELVRLDVPAGEDPSPVTRAAVRRSHRAGERLLGDGRI
jgi:5-methylcytosine-specific restriction endonuclease McrA